MATDGAPGRIITFYSYKGGVGRSMLLANVAWVLAFAGKRVLVVDWDLEAPGIEHFFRPWLGEDLGTFRARRGVIDQLRSYRDLAEARLDAADEPDAEDPAGLMETTRSPNPEVNDGTAAWAGDTPALREPEPDDESNLFATASLRARRAARTTLRNLTVPLSLPRMWPGEIHLIPAGCREDPTEYATAVASFDWARFYADLEGQYFLGRVRDRMHDYDYVLIDSRTGTSETAAVSTIEFADDLVACFGLSDQSIAGVAAVVETFVASRAGQRAQVFPIPMRVDQHTSDRYGPAQQCYERIFNPLIRHQVDNVGAYWADVEVPYDANYAFEELAGPAAGVDPAANRYATACNQLARYLAPEAVDQRLLKRLESATAAIWQSAGDDARRRMPPAFNGVIVSYAEADARWAKWVTWVAESQGLPFVTHLASDPVDVVQSQVDDISYCLLPILSRDYMAFSAAHDLWGRGRRSLTRKGDRRLRPIRVERELGGDGFPDAFGLLLDDEDEEVARHAVAEMLTVPIPRVDAAPAEHQYGAASRTSDGDPAAAAPRPSFPGGTMPLARQYERRLADARRRADDHATMWNALLLAQELGPDRMIRVRLLFAEVVRLATRTGDTLTAAEAWLAWATAEANHERFSLAEEYLGKAKDLLGSAPPAGSDRTAPRHAQLAARVALQATALAKHSSRDGDAGARSGPPESVQRLGSPLAEDAAADAAAERAERLAAEGQDDDAWREFVLARYRYATRGRNPEEAYRAEMGLGQLARKAGSPEDAERYYGDANTTVRRPRKRYDWKAQYQVNRSQADVELHTALSGGSLEDRRDALRRAGRLYEAALDLVAPDDAASPALPEHRPATRIRDLNWYFGSAVRLANVLDMLRELDDPDGGAGKDSRATVLRVEAVRRLDWRDLDPRLEHGEALRAGRDTHHLGWQEAVDWRNGLPPCEGRSPGPPDSTEQLEHAVLAFWVFDRISHLAQADKEYAWIRGSRGDWGIAELTEFVWKTLDPAEATRLVKKLAPIFGPDR